MHWKSAAWVSGTATSAPAAASPAAPGQQPARPRLAAGTARSSLACWRAPRLSPCSCCHLLLRAPGSAPCAKSVLALDYFCCHLCSPAAAGWLLAAAFHLFDGGDAGHEQGLNSSKTYSTRRSIECKFFIALPSRQGTVVIISRMTVTAHNAILSAVYARVWLG